MDYNYLIWIFIGVILERIGHLSYSIITQLNKDDFLKLIQQKEINCVSEVKRSFFGIYYYKASYKGLTFSYRSWGRKLELPSHLEVVRSSLGWLESIY